MVVRSRPSVSPYLGVVRSFGTDAFLMRAAVACLLLIAAALVTTTGCGGTDANRYKTAYYRKREFLLVYLPVWFPYDLSVSAHAVHSCNARADFAFGSLVESCRLVLDYRVQVARSCWCVHPHPSFNTCSAALGGGADSFTCLSTYLKHSVLQRQLLVMSTPS